MPSSYISNSSRRSSRSRDDYGSHVIERPSSTVPRRSSRSDGSSGRYDDDNDTIYPSESSSAVRSRTSSRHSNAGSHRSSHHTSSSDSSSRSGSQSSGSSSRSKDSSNSSASRLRLPRIVEVRPTEDYSLSDEEYILSQWESQKPTSTFGTRYGERPSSQHLGLADQNSSSYSRTGSNSGSQSSHSRSSMSGPPPSQRAYFAYHSDSDDAADYRSRVISSSKRSSYSGSSRHSSRQSGKDLDDGMSRLSMGSRRSSRYVDDEDSEAELELPESYKAGRSRTGSIAGSSASRHRYSRH